jgi:hypothetical protein
MTVAITRCRPPYHYSLEIRQVLYSGVQAWRFPLTNQTGRNPQSK